MLLGSNLGRFILTGNHLTALWILGIPFSLSEGPSKSKLVAMEYYVFTYHLSEFNISIQV